MLKFDTAEFAKTIELFRSAARELGVLGSYDFHNEHRTIQDLNINLDDNTFTISARYLSTYPANNYTGNVKNGNSKFVGQDIVTSGESQKKLQNMLAFISDVFGEENPAQYVTDVKTGNCVWSQFKFQKPLEEVVGAVQSVAGRHLKKSILTREGGITVKRAEISTMEASVRTDREFLDSIGQGLKEGKTEGSIQPASRWASVAESRLTARTTVQPVIKG